MAEYKDGHIYFGNNNASLADSCIRWGFNLPNDITPDEARSMLKCLGQTFGTINILKEIDYSEAFEE